MKRYMRKCMTLKEGGVEFEVEYHFDMDGCMDYMLVFVPDSEVELSGVLDEKVLKRLEEQVYKNIPDGPEDDPNEER